MMLWGSMPRVRVVMPMDSIAAKLLKWFRSWRPIPSGHIMTQEEYTILMAKRKLVGRGKCLHCPADALESVCDECLEKKR